MKRFIKIIASSAVFLVLLNFGLWFYHTREINKSIKSFSNYLHNNGITLTYDEVLFHTFKYWDVKGTIDNLTLATYAKDNKDQKTAEYTVAKVYFESKPLDGILHINTGKEKRVLKTFKPENALISGPTELEIKSDNDEGEIVLLEFHNSISGLLKALDLMNDSKNSKVHIADVIKRFSYSNNNYLMIDTANGLDYCSNKEFSIAINNSIVDTNYKHDLLVHSKNFHYNLDYPFVEASKTTYKDFGFFDQDGVSSEIDFTVLQKDSNSVIETHKNNSLPESEAVKLKKLFNHYQYQINSISYKSSLFNVMLSGTLSLIDNKDLADLKFELTDYANLLSSFAKSFNATTLASEGGKAYGFKEISANDVANVNTFLSQFASSDNLLIAITKGDNGPYKMNDKNASEVFFDFIKILYAKPQEQAQPPVEADKSVPTNSSAQQLTQPSKNALTTKQAETLAPKK